MCITPLLVKFHIIPALRWEFIKEKKDAFDQEKKERKQNLDQEKKERKKNLGKEKKQVSRSSFFLL